MSKAFIFFSMGNVSNSFMTSFYVCFQNPVQEKAERGRHFNVHFHELCTGVFVFEKSSLHGDNRLLQ